MKSIISLMAAAAFGVASFVMPAVAADKGTVGIAMPTKSSARWIDDGNNIVKQLQDAGYTTDLQYADDDIPNQLAQIENMITKGAKVLVIAAIDGTTLSDALQKAHDAGIKVIAYDRLIRDSGNVDYYATFDNFKVGVLQATSIVEALGLKDGKGPFNIELFGGSPDDNNAFFFYDGAMSVLQPYIDSGKLVVQVRPDRHGQGRHAALGSGNVAQARMDNLLSRQLHRRQASTPSCRLMTACPSASSRRSRASATARLKQPLPVVSGQDAEVPSVKSIIAGEQHSTIFKDTRDLAKVTAGMVDALMEGKEPEVNDTKTYDNGVKVVPSYLLKPVAVDKSNYEKILVEAVTTRLTS
jgi:putative multiple sugar transport system substrate-binding protein